MSFRKTEWVLGWLGIDRSHVAIWKWVQKFGKRLGEADRQPAADLPAVVVMDEAVVSPTAPRRSVRIPT